MLNTLKLRSLYAKIQNQLFDLIPEKWDKIYLYACVIERGNNVNIGEMFFYYYPKGLLKKNPINVYEVPAKFNIDEHSYINLVDKLYETIKSLRKEFEKSKEKLWTNLTISIENLEFKIEFNYENLNTSNYTIEDRHIIWQYKYLNLPMERLSKKDREMLETYLLQEQEEKNKTKQYTETIYKNNIHNVIGYNREETYNRIENEIHNDENNIQSKKEKKLDKYSLYKISKEKQKEISDVLEEQEIKKVNQILNF